uniref:Conserved domain protein n=1 Tax=Bursaphelenchus xylophilus TaxID=6326 RepID=A0A1I7RT55_BURXY
MANHYIILHNFSGSKVQLFKDQKTKTETFLLGRGEHTLESGETELLLLFERGEGVLDYNGETFTVPAFHTVRLQKNSKATLKIENGIGLTFKFI